ncbi:MAG: hypothetical protein GC161_05575 [Planctomycetaceae bacterium]|nr:hypothetical protein [Planctomycetaceae bacterium]
MRRARTQLPVAHSDPAAGSALEAQRGRRRPCVLRWLALGFAVLGIALAAGLLWWVSTGRPTRSGTVVVPALVAAVEIHFDDAAVPHVWASDELDLARAIGYLHASERLTQMELGRRYARGTLAEVLGGELEAVDRRSRELRFAESALRNVARLGERSRLWLDAYAEGVNSRIDEGKRPPLLVLLGVRPEPWTPADSLGFAALMAFELASGLDQEFHRLALHRQLGSRLADLAGWDGLDTGWDGAPFADGFPGSDAAQNGTPEPRTGGQSNNWAVAPSHSSSGHALLAGDPHLALGLPPRWYQVRLSAPGYDVQGFTLPGIPLVIVGQSPLRAWSVTTTGLDAEDSFVEDYDPATGTVLRGDRRVPVERRLETIERRGAEPVQLDLLGTDIGPLLPPDGARGLPWRSLAWSLYEPGDPLAVFFALAGARDLDEVFAAAEGYVAPAQNLAIAESSGAIAYTVIGRRPDRGLGDGRLPSPAWDSRFHWRGLRPAAENPRVVRPGDGVLATANADVRPPEYTAAAGAPFTADFAHPSRRDRILEVLRGRSDWDVASMAQLQLDRRSPYALDLVRAIGTGFDGSEDEADREGARKAVELFAGWDGRVEGTGAALLFQVSVATLVAQAREALMGDAPSSFGMVRDALPRLVARDSGWFGEERDRRVARALARAWAQCSILGGPDPSAWRLEDHQTLELQHGLSEVPVLGTLLARGPFGLGGHDSTVNVAWTRGRGEGLAVVGGASLRFVADAADPERSMAILPGGQSGHPFDDHYDDQVADWLEGRMRPMAFGREAVLRRSQSRLELVPAQP